jgi:hypothetical protein
VRESKGAGLALPFLDIGYAKEQSFNLISVDMSVGDAATRRILPETNTSNTMIITNSGRSGEAGGKVIKMGLNFCHDAPAFKNDNLYRQKNGRLFCALHFIRMSKTLESLD